MIGELRGERPMGMIVLGHHHQPRGVLVEPVDDAGRRLAADAGQALAAMRDQRIDERAGPMAGGRMDHEAGGLSMTMMSSSSWTTLSGMVSAAGRRSAGGTTPRSRAGLTRWPGSRIVLRATATRLPDQRLEARARQAAGELAVAGEHAVEPLAGLFSSDQNRCWRCSHRHDDSLSVARSW